MRGSIDHGSAEKPQVLELDLSDEDDENGFKQNFNLNDGFSPSKNVSPGKINFIPATQGKAAQPQVIPAQNTFLQSFSQYQDSMDEYDNFDDMDYSSDENQQPINFIQPNPQNHSESYPRQLEFQSEDDSSLEQSVPQNKQNDFEFQDVQNEPPKQNIDFPSEDSEDLPPVGTHSPSQFIDSDQPSFFFANVDGDEENWTSNISPTLHDPSRLSNNLNLFESQ